METVNDRRKRKLRELCDQHGLAEVASKAGKSSAYIDQILKGVKLPPKNDGTRSERALGNAAARAIEAAYGLGEGWFDTPEQMAPPTGAPPPPKPPADFSDRHEVSESDWALLQDVKIVLSETEIADIRKRAALVEARATRLLLERQQEAAKASTEHVDIPLLEETTKREQKDKATVEERRAPDRNLTGGTSQFGDLPEIPPAVEQRTPRHKGRKP